MHFTTNERTGTLCECIGEAFNYFRGVSRHVLFDNVGTVVVEREGCIPGTA